jgi:hypothetical protein
LVLERRIVPSKHRGRGLGDPPGPLLVPPKFEFPRTRSAGNLVSEKTSSRQLVNRGRVALTGDIKAEEEGLEPSRATTRPPAGPPPDTETVLPKPPQDIAA